MSSSIVEKYSGVVFNQNSATDLFGIVAPVYQEFVLPYNYTRGTLGTEQIIPPLTGFQFMLKIPQGSEDTVGVTWELERQVIGSGWDQLATGVTTGAHTYGDKAWIDVLTDSPIEIGSDMVDSRYRVLLTISGSEGIWCAAPNPLALSFVSAKDSSGIDLLVDGSPISFSFRILSLIADNGTDFLGNNYRSAVIWSGADNTDSLSSPTSMWMSEPCPSKFGVRSLYYDVRPVIGDPSAGNTKVIDRILMDPLTPGVWTSIYYSSEGGPGTNEEEWENKLWKRVPISYRLTKREVHALPEPIETKYIKIEFTHLQARPYDAGNFARPVRYRKHPKWVLDYFLARLSSDATPGTVAVIYDAYDLAFNYYLDDLHQDPRAPTPADLSAVTNFLTNRTDFSDQIDPAMLDQIRVALEPYKQAVQSWAQTDYILGLYSRSNISTTQQTEIPSPTSDLGVLRNSAVEFEQGFPVMFFYLTCRHNYREVIAPFEKNLAYFAGVKEIAFMRDNYATAYDTSQYTEPAGDVTNIERNDLITIDGIMRTH